MIRIHKRIHEDQSFHSSVVLRSMEFQQMEGKCGWKKLNYFCPATDEQRQSYHCMRCLRTKFFLKTKIQKVTNRYNGLSKATEHKKCLKNKVRKST